MKRYGVVWLAFALLLSGFIWLIERLNPALAVGSLVTDWWPVALIAIGLAGAARLRTPLGVARGPIIFAFVGVLVLAIVHNPVPDRWRPVLLPLALCAAGLTILVVKLTSAPSPPLRPIERFFLIGQGRRVPWPVASPSILAIHAIASGSIVTIPDSAAAKAGRIEITAFLSDVEVIVPRGWTVYFDTARANSGTLHGVNPAPDAATADLQVRSLNILGTVDVRSAN